VSLYKKCPYTTTEKAKYLEVNKMKPMNIEFLSEMARKEKETLIVCSEMSDSSDERMEVFEQYIAVINERMVGYK
jgi:hypothetical protein